MLFLLLLLALAIRILNVINNIPFSFDHGRDALAVMHLIKTGNLKFIGPWTSIPGLFFGPGWYYLLAPMYWLTQGNPLAGPITMIIISLLQIWLAHKYFGWIEAIIMACAPIFIILSASASNPFPIVLITLLIFICLKNPTKHSFKLGLLIGLGFHFSSAFAIFYLLIIPLVLVIKQIKFNLGKVVSGLVIPFIPQILFELKNNFIEVKAVIKYFSIGESQQITFGKIMIVTKSIINELGLAILPDQPQLRIVAIGLLLVGLFWVIKYRKKINYLLEICLFLIIPTIGFWWLHFNIWYIYGLLPAIVIGLGQILKHSPKWLIYGYLSLLIIDNIKIPTQQNGAAFLKTKLQAINYIYQQAGDASFNSYHYLPNIYDYDYQYLYFWQGFKGRQLPAEFSYQIGEISYVTEKSDLLKLFPTKTNKAEKTFLIIEKPENIWHYPLNNWLNNFKYEKIISRQTFGPELEVWQVK